MTKLYKSHQKRIKAIVVLTLLLISVTTIRTLYIQFFKNNTVSNYINKKVEGDRGVIFDRNGVKLAYDIDYCDLYLDNLNFSDFDEVKYFMKEYFNKSIDFDSLKIQFGSSKVPLIEGISKRKVMALKNVMDRYPSIKKSITYKGRYYPKKDLASQLIGKFSHKRNSKGLWGVEHSMNDFLKGKISNLPYYVTARGSKKKDFSEEDFNKLLGNNVTLTIDIEYQRILEQELVSQLKKTNSKTANGIIVNPYNGEILALASVPGSNLNQSLSNQERSRDYSTSYNYEPGSTLKPFSILAGLKQKKITLSDKYYCEKGEYYIPDIRRKIIDHEPRDTLTVKEILAYSSNIGMAKISSDIGQKDIYEMLRVFGFGQDSGLSYYNEEKGSLKKIKDWVPKHSRIAMSIGQEINATNLQLAMAYSAIANGGYLLKPKIIKGIVGEKLGSPDPGIIRKVADKKDLNLLIEALKMTVISGTAESLYSDDYCSYGKTGTSQVFDKDKGKYSDSTYIASYASVFPCEKPKLVCIVSFLEPNIEYRWATQTAVPVVQKILDKILIKDKDLAIEILDEVE